MTKRVFTVVAVIALIMAMTSVSLADVPQLISFQGKLYDHVGSPLTGQFKVTFRIYNQETGPISPVCPPGLLTVSTTREAVAPVVVGWMMGQS